jgi:hypothetical protein
MSVRIHIALLAIQNKAKLHYLELCAHYKLLWLCVYDCMRIAGFSACSMRPVLALSGTHLDAVYAHNARCLIHKSWCRNSKYRSVCCFTHYIAVRLTSTMVDTYYIDSLYFGTLYVSVMQAHFYNVLEFSHTSGMMSMLPGWKSALNRPSPNII